MSEVCDVILVFVNENEKNAVYNAFKDKHTRDPVVEFGEVLTYHDFGTIGGAKVLGLQIEMGNTTPGGSAVAIFDALKEKRPQYLILVGIAFGMDRNKQRIGDILVSQKLCQYEAEKIGSGKNGEPIEMPRGDITTIEQGILGRFRALSNLPFWQGASVHFGLMVSGDKLIDNAKFKGKLRKFYPEAIGGDMEAAGAYVAARRYRRDWIVVKGVCDYADGNKKRNKQKNQELAARNAAQLVFQVLEQGNFGGSFSITGKKEKTGEEKTTPPNEAIKKRVKENITQLLEKEKMKDFRRSLMDQLPKPKDGSKRHESHQLAAALVNINILEAVSILDLAVKKSIEDIKGASGNVELIDFTWTGSVNILGWLVLLGVNEEWADTTIRFMSEQKVNLDLTIPVKTGAGVEIVVSRLKEDKACLDIDEETRDVLSKRNIHYDSLGKIDAGWNSGDKVLVIKKALRKQLIKVDLPENAVFTKEMDIDLNETIKAKNERGEHHYLAVDRSCQYHPLLEKEVYEALLKDLPDLEIFFIELSDREVAIISETRLHARLRLFFENKPGIRKENDRY